MSILNKVSPILTLSLLLFSFFAIFPAKSSAQGLNFNCQLQPDGTEVCNNDPNTNRNGGGTLQNNGNSASVGRINTVQLGVPTDINGIIASLVQLVYAVAGIVFFFMFIYGGLRYLLAGGDEKATMAARGTLTNAFIGLVIVVAAFVITQLLFSLFHINSFIRLG
ncbi:MAG TPA: pilin [Candidatus Saccharimonadales bacterium]|nr:pilin [Candidatus Saccharimonadales bacterium]